MKRFLRTASLFLLITAYVSCSNSDSTKTESKEINSSKEHQPDFKAYLLKGKQHALATKKVLGKNLIGQISTNGTEAALSFCNIKAPVLTDSMSNTVSAKITRVSDQYRNPNNKGNAMEQEYISQSKAHLENKEKVKPQMQEVNGKMVGYYPIMTNKLCLQCHGTIDTDITPSVLSLINEKYPEDKAVGYVENELRGIWVIEMDKEIQ